MWLGRKKSMYIKKGKMGAHPQEVNTRQIKL
jgi:hypothetical protein